MKEISTANISKWTDQSCCGRWEKALNSIHVPIVPLQSSLRRSLSLPPLTFQGILALFSQQINCGASRKRGLFKLEQTLGPPTSQWLLPCSTETVPMLHTRCAARALDAGSVGERRDLLIPRLCKPGKSHERHRDKGCRTNIKCIVFKYSPSHFVYLSLNSSPLNLSPLH